jgi:pimeloyl-ACP methyl ester carboxylesterase
MQAEFRFTAYDDLFDRAALNLATVLEAVARLSASGIVHGIGDLFRPRGLGALSERVRWTAGMVAQWAADEPLRKKTRQAVERDLAEFDPHLVLAHSLGSLITYDLLAQGPGLVAGRTLVTFGSQIGNPFVRSMFGGRIVALPGARRWFHLFNSEDDVFTARLRVPASNFEQVDTLFDVPGIADHDAAQYLAHSNTVTRVWREIAQPAALGLAREQKVLAQTERRPRRRALLVGINDYPEPENRLEGCVNDVFEMSAVLQDLKFDPEEIRVVLNERATTEGIQERLHWLLDGADDEAIRVFFYSGHGAQMPGYGERGEVDHVNECLVPYDFDWTPEHAILDDWFLDLYSQLPYRTNFVGIFDCCHSGGMTRNGLPKARGLNPPDDIRHRALRWNGEMWVPRELNLAKQKLLQSKADQPLYLGERGETKRLGRAVSLWTEERSFQRAKKAYGHAGPYVPVLLQACREHELSYEYRHGVTAYGAFTYCLSSLFRSLKTTGKSVTFETLARQAAVRLKRLGYPQTPVLFGPRRKTRQPIPYLRGVR